jgi:hypothetical protein
VYIIRDNYPLSSNLSILRVPGVYYFEGTWCILFVIITPLVQSFDFEGTWLVYIIRDNYPLSSNLLFLRVPGVYYS